MYSQHFQHKSAALPFYKCIILNSGDMDQVHSCFRMMWTVIVGFLCSISSKRQTSPTFSLLSLTNCLQPRPSLLLLFLSSISASHLLGCKRIIVSCLPWRYFFAYSEQYNQRKKLNKSKETTLLLTTTFMYFDSQVSNELSFFYTKQMNSDSPYCTTFQ